MIEANVARGVVSANAYRRSRFPGYFPDTGRNWEICAVSVLGIPACDAEIPGSIGIEIYV
jgi:hypothetical protein